MKKNVTSFAIALVLISSVATLAQKKSDGIDKIVFGSYKVGQIDLKEYAISKSGEILYTARMDKNYAHIGHLGKTEMKELFAYCDSKQWTDYIKFNPGKDYKYIRLYTGKEYTEMMWAENGADAQMHEAFTKLSKLVEGYTLPDPVMAAQH